VFQHFVSRIKTKTLEQFTKGEILFLFAVCAANLAFIMLGIKGDCPVALEADEACYGPGAVEMMRRHSLNPMWFANPASTLYYPLVAYYSVLRLIYGANFIDLAKDGIQNCYEHMNLLVLYPRICCGLLVTASLPFIYWAGRKWLGKYPAMVGTILYAVCPLVVAYGQMLRTDMVSCFFVALGMVLIVKLIEHADRLKYAVMCALVLALGMSTRYFCLALAAPFVVAYGLYYKQTRERKVLFNALWFAMLTAVFFFCSSPFVFLDYKNVEESLRFEAFSVFGRVDGLGFFGNLNFYINEVLPSCLSHILAVASIIGLVLVVWKRRSDLTWSFLMLLLAFVVGTCLNPRHWHRWILPFLPMLCFFVGVTVTTSFEILKKSLQTWLGRTKATRISAGIVSLLLFACILEQLRGLYVVELDMLRPTGRAEAWYYIRDHIPPHTKIALDSDWRWTGRWNYDYKEDIWRSDFIPPRPHNYKSPVDLAKEGFQYMVVETWNRGFYTWGQPQRYPTECEFFKELRKHAPLLLKGERRPKVLGVDPIIRISPYEIYDLRPLAKGVTNANEVLNDPNTE